MTTTNTIVRKLCLSKRVKNYWRKSNSPVSLKIWARSQENSDVRAWLKLKVTVPAKSTKMKIAKTLKSEKLSEKKRVSNGQ